MSTSVLATGAGQRLASVAMGTDFGNVKYSRSVGGEEVEVPASAIQLALHGGGLTELDTIFFKFIMQMLWAAYQACVRVVAWFANFAMSMDWLNAIRAPFESIEEVLQNILRTYNLYATMLIITAFICIIWMARGRWGQGIAELFVALVIANYAIASVGSTATDSTPLPSTSPIELMLGNDNDNDNDNNGLIYEARDFGTGIVGQLDGGIEGDNTYNPMTPGDSIVESFLWYPVQLVNFGEVLTEPCQDAYAIVLEAIGENKGEGDGPEVAERIRQLVPGTPGDRAADAVGDHVYYDEEAWAVPGACQHNDDEYYKDQATIEGIITQWFLGPSVGLLALVIVIMAGAVVLAGVNAVVQCFKVLLALLIAILPRGGRRSLWVTIGSAVTALLILAFTIIFLGTFLVIVQQVLAPPSGGPTSLGARIGTFLLVDILLVVGLIIFWRGRKALAQSNEKMADALGKMSPGGGGGGGGAAKAAAGSGMMKSLGAFHTGMDVQRDLTGGRHVHDLMGRRRGGWGGPGSVATSANGGGGFGGGGAGGGAARTTGGAMVRAGAVKGAKKLVGTAALGAATGGSSLLVQGGAVAAKSGALKVGAKASRSLVANAGRSARWVGNRGAHKWHKKRQNWDQMNRAEAVNRRRDLARRRRLNDLKLQAHDGKTRGYDFAARLTNGRLGTAQKLQERATARDEKRRHQNGAFLDKHKEYAAKDMADRSRMTPVQRVTNDAWREDKMAKLKKKSARRAARRKGGFT